MYTFIGKKESAKKIMHTILLLTHAYSMLALNSRCWHIHLLPHNAQLAIQNITVALSNHKSHDQIQINNSKIEVVTHITIT